MAEQRKQAEEVAFFDRAALGWSNRYEEDASFFQRKQSILAAVNALVPEGARLLDFGCGAGDLSSACLRSGYRVVGSDVAKGMLVQARERLTAEGYVPSVVGLEEGSPLLPFDDLSFGGCVASSVLEYVPDVLATLTELARVLEPGACLVATVPNSEALLRRKEWLLQALLKLPLVRRLMMASRWQDGVQYLTISRNRGNRAWWIRMLLSAGFVPREECFDDSVAGGALTLLVAEKCRGA